MTRRLLWHFLRDRLWVVGLTYVHTAMLLALLCLVLAPEGHQLAAMAENLLYALLLSTSVLVIGLGARLVRWWPFASQAARLTEADIDRALVANMNPGGTLEQQAFATLLAKAYDLSTTELLHYQQAHERHLAFIHLWVHQMKTPVAAINLTAQQAGEQEPDELYGAMQQVEAESRKLTDGLDLVLNMARLSDFALDTRIERVDLLEAVRRVINDRKKQFIRLGIYPEVEADAGDWVVLTDDKWNRFAIDQIVSNALKYGSQGGAPGQRLRIRLGAQERAVVLTITDQGPGIPPQDLPRVFEPFFTGANGRRFGQATGIGLYLVKKVLDQLDHRILITATEGEGTTVQITYPLGRLQS